MQFDTTYYRSSPCCGTVSTPMPVDNNPEFALKHLQTDLINNDPHNSGRKVLTNFFLMLTYSSNSHDYFAQTVVDWVSLRMLSPLRTSLKDDLFMRMPWVEDFKLLNDDQKRKVFLQQLHLWSPKKGVGINEIDEGHPSMINVPRTNMDYLYACRYWLSKAMTFDAALYARIEAAFVSWIDRGQEAQNVVRMGIALEYFVGSFPFTYQTMDTWRQNDGAKNLLNRVLPNLEPDLQEAVSTLMRMV